jgi:integrase
MLTAKKVERTTKPGRYRCGLVQGLLLQISDGGTKSWVLRYELNGRERWMGLGSASVFTLKQARERALQARQLLADGLDPLAAKQTKRQAARVAAARKLTFAEAAQGYFDQNESQWRSASHRDQFMSSLRADAFPAIGAMDVAAIGLPDVLRVIEPLWKTKTPTADRIRSRIQRVLDWCVVRGHRPPGTNPAQWRGHLDQVLPAPRKVAPIEHHRAMDYRAVPQFMAELRQQEGVAARALEFLILSAARTGEVLGAQWSEVDSDSKIWTIPGHRMKAGREHRVPLTKPVLDLLGKLPREADNPLVFIKGQAGLSKMAMAHVMERLGQSGKSSIHGFRSCFATWSHERTAHSAHTVEISLAHNVGSAVEQAYRRTDMIVKRRQLMEQWAKFCSMPPAKISGDVVALRGGR